MFRIALQATFINRFKVSSFNKILRFLNWKQEGQEGISNPGKGNAEFVLLFGKYHIGTLSFSEGLWTFSYSTYFKTQQETPTIIDFPNKNQVYKSNDLWPFFAVRVPGKGQTEAQAIIQKEGIDPTDEVALLSRFGKKTISNPFQLIAQ